MKKSITPFLFTGVVCLGMLWTSLSAMAQKTIHGKVVSSTDNQVVIGATVKEKGTANGTVTGPDGSFSLKLTGNGNEVLEVSFIGYNPKDVPVGNQTNLVISLDENTSTLNEVVVTGYSTQRKGDITGAVSTVNTADLTTIPSGSPEQQLQGKLSGVTVITSGMPGTSSQVRIRGFGSFTTNNPYYVVDGVPTGDISNISPDDIESVSVLKDAASASIYGASAFSGVILITTKKGKEGKLSVRYNASYGVQYPGHGYDILSPQQTADWTWTAMKNAGETPKNDQYGTGPTPVLPYYLLVGDQSGLPENTPIDPSLYNVNYDNGPIYQIVKANQQGTDWYKEITRVAPIQYHNLTLSGGSESAKYNVGLSYYNQQGIILATYLKRYILRANTEFNIKKRVKIGENLQVSLKDNPTLTNQSEGNAISWTYRENPIIPVHDIMGGWAGTRAAGLNNPQNPVANQVRSEDNRSYTPDIFGNVYAEVTLPYHINLRSSFGGEFWNTYYQNFTYHQYENKENNGSDVVSEGASYAHSWIWTNTATFENHFGDHYLKVLLGVEAKGGYAQNLDVTGQNPFSTDLTYRTITTTSPANRTATDGGNPQTRFYSLFGNVNYSYKDKYLVTGTLRRDQASVFGPEQRTGVFPAASLGWRISGENFMKDASWINDLKIRGSWGTMGNATAVPLGNQFNLYEANSRVTTYDMTGALGALEEGLRSSGFAVLATHWETNETINAGFDATLFNNSLNIVFDWYKRNTKDLLFAPEIEATIGFLNQYPYINVGSMENKGIDLQIEKQGNFSENWRYDIGANLTTYKNTITKVAEGVDYFDGSSFGSGRIPGTVTRNQDKHPISAFFGYKVIGLWQNQQEIDEADAQAQKAETPQETFQSGGEHPGEFRYDDVNGDGIISDADRTFIGDPNPNLTYGVNLAAGYKNFDLRFEFYGSQGNDIFDYTRWFTDFYPSFPGGALNARILKSWTPENTNTNVPVFEDRGTFSTNQAVNSYYVQNGSYFRCRNIQLSYTFNKGGALQKAGIENLRLYAQVVNPFTITKYEGLDPELSGNDTNFGVDYGNYPTVKQLIFGLNVNF